MKTLYWIILVGMVWYLPEEVSAQRLYQNNDRGVYAIPFASTQNVIELTIVNGSSSVLTDISVIPQRLPAWIHMAQSQARIPLLGGNKETAIRFTFSIDKNAPVNQEQSLAFSIMSQNG